MTKARCVFKHRGPLHPSLLHKPELDDAQDCNCIVIILQPWSLTFDPVSSSVPVAPTERPESVCERWRASLIEHYGGKADPQQYVPQCGPDGQFSPVQCYGETTYCWCVDQDGREVPGTRSHDAVKPACECQPLCSASPSTQFSLAESVIS